jgi:xylulose-5-phosphate/fructose-6-phosphate phosphoketolase
MRLASEAKAWEGHQERAAELRQRMVDARLDARHHTREHAEDAPAIADWT